MQLNLVACHSARTQYAAVQNSSCGCYMFYLFVFWSAYTKALVYFEISFRLLFIKPIQLYIQLLLFLNIFKFNLFLQGHSTQYICIPVCIRVSVDGLGENARNSLCSGRHIFLKGLLF